MGVLLSLGPVPVGQARTRAGEGAEMTGDDVREVFGAIVSQEGIDRLCVDRDVIARQRMMNLGILVRAIVVPAGTPGGAYQADILRSSSLGPISVSSLRRIPFYVASDVKLFLSSLLRFRHKPKP